MCSRLVKLILSKHIKPTTYRTLKHLSQFNYLQSNNVIPNQAFLLAPDEIPANQSLPVIDLQFNSKILKISPEELENNIKSAKQVTELFDVISNYSSTFKPHHLERFIKHFTLLTCYDKKTNKYASSFVEIPDHVDKLLVKQIIRLSPHFEHETNLEVLERLMLLGYGSKHRCVRAILHLTKHQINSFDLKGILRFKAALDKLEKSVLVTGLLKGLNLVVKAKKSDIYSLNMKYIFLREFPSSYTEEEFEDILVGLRPEWHMLAKNKRFELVEMILGRSKHSRELLQKISKVVKVYFKQKKDFLVSEDSVTDKDKFDSLNLMHNLINSMSNSKTNFYETDFYSKLLEFQVDILRTITFTEDNLIEFGANLNIMLELCLKFNFYSVELLLLVSTKGIVDEMSLMSLMPANRIFRKDLFLCYAGLCDFTNLSEDDLQACIDYTIQNKTDDKLVQRALTGLYCLRKSEKFSLIKPDISVNEFILNHIKQKEKADETDEIVDHLKELVSGHAEEFEINEANLGDLQNLVDLEIIKKVDGTRCFVHIERKFKGFKNVRKLKNDTRLMIEFIQEGVRRENAILWQINSIVWEATTIEEYERGGKAGRAFYKKKEGSLYKKKAKEITVEELRSAFNQS